MTESLTAPEKEEIIEGAQEAFEEMAKKATEEYQALNKEEESEEDRESYLHSLRF